MSRVHSPEEIRQEHLDVLGTKLGPIYYALWNECAWLNLKWQQYLELFGSRPERVDILNESAGLFFRVVQDTLWGDILLHLAALTDPPKSRGRKNLTLQALEELVLDEGFREELTKAVKLACAATEFARDWRNRRIAHRDHDLFTRQPSAPLPRADRQHVQEAVDAISAVVKLMSGHYFNADIILGVMSEPGNAVALLYVLRDGLEFQQHRRERLLEGRARPDDEVLPANSDRCRLPT